MIFHLDNSFFRLEPVFSDTSGIKLKITICQMLSTMSSRETYPESRVLPRPSAGPLRTTETPLRSAYGRTQHVTVMLRTGVLNWCLWFNRFKPLEIQGKSVTL